MSVDEKLPAVAGLSDNEKAATFIGWEHGTRCKNTDERLSMLAGSLDPKWACACPGANGVDCGERSFNREHDLPAPDMSCPENYMRVLEARSSILHIGQKQPCHAQVRGGVPMRWCHGEGAIIGEAVIKALASLYDFETREAVEG